MEDIKGLQEDLHDLLDQPGITLEGLWEIRSELEAIKALREDVE